MRVCSLVALSLSSIAYVLAAPAALSNNARSLTTGICYLEAALGVPDVEDTLDSILGGAVSTLEQDLGLTQLESGLGLTGCATKGLSDLQLLGKAVCYLEKGLGVDKAEDLLDSALGGALTALEDKLGVTDLEQALKLVDC
ncbi:unnamed protein product [Parajaminaea phylloscopi]